MRLCCFFFAFAAASRAGLCAITFTDSGANNVGYGQIDVENGYAISGSFVVTAGTATGSWTLYVAGGTGGTWNHLLRSPLNAFNYDNAVYVDPTANPQYPGSAFLDNGGLLFTDGNNDEINLFGDGNGVYSLYADIGGARYNPAVNSGTATIEPIPERVNRAMAGFGLILIGVGACRLWRRHSVRSSRDMT